MSASLVSSMVPRHATAQSERTPPDVGADETIDAPMAAQTSNPTPRRSPHCETAPRRSRTRGRARGSGGGGPSGARSGRPRSAGFPGPARGRPGPPGRFANARPSFSWIGWPRSSSTIAEPRLPTPLATAKRTASRYTAWAKHSARLRSASTVSSDSARPPPARSIRSNCRHASATAVSNSPRERTWAPARLIRSCSSARSSCQDFAAARPRSIHARTSAAARAAAARIACFRDSPLRDSAGR